MGTSPAYDSPVFDAFYDESVKLETPHGLVRDVLCSVMDASTDDPLLDTSMSGSQRQSIEIVFPSYSQDIVSQARIGGRVVWRGKTWAVSSTKQDIVLGTVLTAREKTSDGIDSNPQL